MKTLLRISAISLCISTISACSSVNEAMYGERMQPSAIHLTLLSSDPLTQGKPTHIKSKITHLKILKLVTRNEMQPTQANTLPMIAIDTSFSDVQIIDATPTNIDGLYDFTFTPHKPGSYRIWAETKLKSAPHTEYPYSDIGTRTPGKFTRTELLEQKQDGITYALKIENPLTRFDNEEITVQATDNSGTNIPVTLRDIVGIYGDYRTVIHLTPDNGKISFSPDKEGLIKLFVRLTANGKETTVAFTAAITKN